MRCKPSCCVALEGPDKTAAFQFYTNVLALSGIVKGDDLEVSAPPLRLFPQKGEPRVVFELIVPSLEAAREDVVDSGCSVDRWGGAGKPCYIVDPFGFCWNLREDPDEFQTNERPRHELAKVEGKVRFSNCFAFGVADRKRAATFYRAVFGFLAKQESENWTELDAGPLRIFLCRDDVKGPVGSIDVRNRDETRIELETAGCKVTRWEPEKSCTFMVDPFGFQFDVYEDPSAFL